MSTPPPRPECELLAAVTALELELVDAKRSEFHGTLSMELTLRELASLGRNDPCPCGSGKKYKRCHLDANEAARAKERLSAAATAQAANEPAPSLPDLRSLERTLAELRSTFGTAAPGGPASEAQGLMYDA